MAYVKIIEPEQGESLDESIKTYLDLNLRGLTKEGTILGSADRPYPIGYFNEETIGLFKSGLQTVNQLSSIMSPGGSRDHDAYKTCANQFAQTIFSEYKCKDWDKSWRIRKILEGFDNITTQTIGIPMFDEEAKEIIRQQIDELDRQNNMAK